MVIGGDRVHLTAWVNGPKRPGDRMLRHAIAAAALGAVLIFAGCATNGPPAPIPAPMAESIPKPPVSATPLIWQTGHWDWTGNAYVWVPGQYVTAEGHSNIWNPAFWEKTAAGWVWHPAHWG
jgi:WXXGXW repeat (2 copies)